MYFFIESFCMSNFSSGFIPKNPNVKAPNLGNNPIDNNNNGFFNSNFLPEESLKNSNVGYGLFSQPIAASQIENFLGNPTDSNQMSNSFKVPLLEIPSFSSSNMETQPQSLQNIFQNTDNSLLNSLSPAQQAQLNSLPPNILESAKGYLNEIGGVTSGINDIAQRSALQQAQSQYIDAFLEAEGTKKMLQINNQSTKNNAILDQQNLALRANYNILTKQTEQYVLDAQLREQLTNLFFNLEKTIMENTFQRAKSVVNAAKY